MNKFTKLSAIALIFCFNITSSALADYDKGMKALTVENYPLAFEEFIITAETGHIVSSLLVAELYAEGKGTEKNIRKAIYWFKEAAKGGNAKAQYNLGIIYQLGNGEAINLSTAAEYYKLAADQNDHKSQVNLGEMYMQGKGVVQDYKKAVKLFVAAAQSENPLGYYSIGYCFEHGLGLPKDTAKAKIWYKQALKLGYKDAEKRLKEIEALVK